MSLNDFIQNDCTECDQSGVECVVKENFRLFHWDCARRVGWLNVDLMPAHEAYKRINGDHDIQGAIDRAVEADAFPNK